MNPVTNPWDADIEISEGFAAGLTFGQFPELAPVRLEPFGEGWDNAAFLVNERYVFRFPRRSRWAWTIENECRALPVLRPHLQLAVPNPEFVGRPTPNYPYLFAGYPILPGITACRVEWTDADRAANAEPLARLLAALHAIPVDEETRAWAPVDTIDRANTRKRAPMVTERVRSLSSWPLDMDREAVCALVNRLAESESWQRPTCWVHGDLYARHLLVDDSLQLCGVIDWGDVHLGDPALDLSIAFSFLPPEARAAFREAYGPIDDATWDRARFKAIFYGPPLIAYGSDVGDDAIRAAGEYALASASAGFDRSLNMAGMERLRG